MYDESDFEKRYIKKMQDRQNRYVKLPDSHDAIALQGIINCGERSLTFFIWKKLNEGSGPHYSNGMQFGRVCLRKEQW